MNSENVCVVKYTVCGGGNWQCQTINIILILNCCYLIRKSQYLYVGMLMLRCADFCFLSIWQVYLLPMGNDIYVLCVYRYEKRIDQNLYSIIIIKNIHFLYAFNNCLE